MKKFWLLAMCAFCAPAVSHAQSYNKAHQLSASDLKSSEWPTYRKGEKFQFKSNVMALQYLLRNRGVYKSNVDGIFGDTTEAAVRNFQRAKGLKVDGIVGPQTWPHLLLKLKKGDKGDAVRALQIALRGTLNDDGQPPFIKQEVDGVFGASTLKNLRTFQKGYSEREVDGITIAFIAAGRTWDALLRANNAYGD